MMFMTRVRLTAPRGSNLKCTLVIADDGWVR
jgi:hypothetical protein